MTKSQDAEVAASTTATLKLASEAGAGRDSSSGGSSGNGGNGVSGSEAAAHDDASAGLLTNVKRCISVGPFRDVAEAAHAASTLRSGGYDPRPRVVDGVGGGRGGGEGGSIYPLRPRRAAGVKCWGSSRRGAMRTRWKCRGRMMDR